MFQVEFSFNGKNTTIHCNSEDKMKNIIEEFTNKVKIEKNSVYFLYKGEKINENLSLNLIANVNNNKINKINILVNSIDINSDINKNKSIIKSKDIICQKYGELAKIKLDSYTITSKCKNKHVINDISFDEFEKS